MANLSISKAWDDSRPIIASDGNLMFAVALATIVVPGTLLYMMDPSQADIAASASADMAEPEWGTFLVSLIGGLIGIIGSIAISYLALMPGKSVGDALRRGVKRMWVTIGAVLLLMIPIFVAIIVFALVAVAAAGVSLESTRAADFSSMSGTAVLLVLLLLALAVVFAVRLSLLTPVIAAEEGGPLHAIKRSWHLTGGHFWRLLGFFILIFIGAIIVIGGIGLIAGLILALIFGDPEPMSVGALFYGLVSTVLQAAVTVIYSVMVARIYRQLSVEPAATPGVPDAGGA